MYLISIFLLLLVCPAASVAVEAVMRYGTADLVTLVGKWFTFWAVGVRLFLAGLRQVARPQFTATGIFAIKDRAADAIAREVGFGNLAMGALGLLTMFKHGWLVPAAIVGALYYGLAGAGHAARGRKNFNGWAALISDLSASGVLAAFIASRGI